MKTWTRAAFVRICGDCGRLVNKGEAILELTLQYRGARTRIVCIRCDRCAGPAPPDLPVFVERATPATAPMAHILTGAGALPFDFKAAAAHEREPGEEG